MINQFRADFYRQIHTTRIYILTILVIIFSTSIIRYHTVAGVMMTSSTQNSLDRVLAGSWNSLLGVRSLTVSSSLLLYGFIGIFVSIFGNEFIQKIYKNSLTSGISRTNFLLSKYLLMLIDIIFLSLIYFISGIVNTKILNPRTSVPSHELFTTTLGTTFVISFFISVIFGMAIFLLLLTNSIVISTTFIGIFPFLTRIAHTLFKWDWLKYLDFFGITIQFTIKQITPANMIPYLEVGGALLIASYILSNFLLRNKEL